MKPVFLAGIVLALTVTAAIGAAGTGAGGNVLLASPPTKGDALPVASSSETEPTNTNRKSIDFADLIPGGLLKARAELAFRHLQEDYFQWGSISRVNFQLFPGDAIGRTINGLTLLSQALHQPTPVSLQEIMRRVPELANSDGYLGPKLPDSRANEDVLAAHNGYACGLAEYALWTKDPTATESLKRVVTNLFVPARGAIACYREKSDAAAKVNWHLSGGDIGQLFLLLDGATRAYERNPSPELKATVETMIARYQKLDLVKISAQTHSMLSATRGILRWHELCHRAEDLAFAVSLYRQYRDLAMTETYENHNWFNRPAWTEACAVVDSFLVATELWRFTGKAEYLADAHHILYNGLLPGQLRNGGFGTGPCVGALDRKGQLTVRTRAHGEAPWCCSMRGGEGLARAIQYGYFLDGDAVVLPFYCDSTATPRFADGAITIRQTTRYPYDGQVRVEITESTVTKRKSLRLFIPPWALPGSVSLTVGGKQTPLALVDPFATVSGLSKGDVIELAFKQASGTQGSLHPAKLPGARRYFRGALLLGASSSSVEPTKPILDILDPAQKVAPESPVVLFLGDAATKPAGRNQATRPANLADSAIRYDRGAPADKVPAEAKALFLALKHDKPAAILGLVWKQPQIVTQVILQWPDDAQMPKIEEITIRWSVAGTIHEAAKSGVIGNGRQWVYTLDPSAKEVELDNLVIAVKGGQASSPPVAVPVVTVVGR